MAIFCLLKNYIFDNSNLTRAHMARLIQRLKSRKEFTLLFDSMDEVKAKNNSND
jgi:hypothetical protein